MRPLVFLPLLLLAPAAPALPHLPFDADRAAALRSEWAEALDLDPGFKNRALMKQVAKELSRGEVLHFARRPCEKIAKMQGFVGSAFGVVFAVIGGPTVQLAKPAASVAPTTMADMPCGMAMPVADAGHGAPMAPCKGLTPECIKQMGCIVDVALPARPAGSDVAVTFTAVSYWAARSELAGLIREPEPLPPRTT